jgi:O-antigen ligase
MAATQTAAAAPPAPAAGPPAPRRPVVLGDRAGTALLAVLLALCAYAAFAHGAIDLAAEARVQVVLALAGLAVAALALGAGRLVPRTAPAGWAGVALLAGFAAWCGLSIAWSLTGDLSWQETNRAVAYALAALLALAVGAHAPRAIERTALGLVAVAVAVALYALAGKVAPGLVDETALSPRLREPLGYWNALALLCVLGAPAALRVATDASHRDGARLAGLGALWLLVVTAALTYSRGAALALVAALVVVTVLGEARLRGLAAVALAALAAAPAIALAFTDDTLTTAGAPLADRIGAGRGLLAVLVACLLALVAAGVVALRLERRVAWPAAWTRSAWRALAAAAVLAALVLLATGTVGRSLSSFGDTHQAPSISAPSRLLSTNSGNRVTWWNEALGAWSALPWQGHGAGSFPVLHLQYRHNTLNVRQPHDVPLEFLAETGIVGAVLGVGGLLALLWAATAAVRARPPGTRERELGAALLAAGVAWGMHALVDWDWDIPAVTLPALLALGVVAAAPAAPGVRLSRARPLALVAVALAGWVYLVSVALPAVADSRASSALREARAGASPGALADAAARANLASRLDPLSNRGLFAGAAIAERRDRRLEERRLLLDAVHRRPSDAQAWVRLAGVGIELGDLRGAVAATRAALRLDPRGPQTLALAADAQILLAPPRDSPTATGTPLGG